MTSGRSIFLVDTNILVYGYDPSDAAKQARAIALLEHLVVAGTGALSTQVLSEFFNTVKRKIPTPLTPAAAERELTNLVRAWVVFDVTPVMVLEAVHGAQRFQLPYWDALIWAAARVNGVPNVLSEDFNDGAVLDGVRFSNPFSAGFDVARLACKRSGPLTPRPPSPQHWGEGGAASCATPDRRLPSPSIGGGAGGGGPERLH